MASADSMFGRFVCFCCCVCLWYREEAIFNREFAPFYRVQQVVVTPAVNKTDSLLKPEYIKDLLQLSLDINAIQADIEMYSEDGKPYTDVRTPSSRPSLPMHCCL